MSPEPAAPLGAAVDPGHLKCGLAALAPDGTVVLRQVLPPAQLPAALAGLADSGRLAWVVVGDGTRSAETLAAVRTAVAPVPVLRRDETGTSLLGRARYWREHPPKGLWRLIPTSLRLPPEPFDDWVAVILAERYLAELAAARSM
jgi:hypothetical protein